MSGGCGPPRECGYKDARIDNLPEILAETRIERGATHLRRKRTSPTQALRRKWTLSAISSVPTTGGTIACFAIKCIGICAASGPPPPDGVDGREDGGGGGIFDLSAHIHRDSILYDATQGFVFASLFTLAAACMYRLCLGCCIRCGVCPDDRVLMLHRRHRRGVNGYALVRVTDFDDDDSDDIWGSDSEEDSVVSMEYGRSHAAEDGIEDAVDRFEEKQIARAAERYFQEKKQRQKAKSPGKLNKLGKLINVRGGTGKKKNRHKGGGARSTGSLSTASILDDEELPPLDLELIERKIVDSMGDDFVQPITSSKTSSGAYEGEISEKGEGKSGGNETLLEKAGLSETSTKDRSQRGVDLGCVEDDRGMKRKEENSPPPDLL